MKTIQSTVWQELLERARELPLQLSVRDVARFMNIGLSLAYKVVHGKDFPKMQMSGVKRLMVPKLSFLEWYAREIGFDREDVEDKEDLDAQKEIRVRP